MQTPARRCERLIAALDDLVGQEEASLNARDFSAVAEIQVRTAALVAELVAQAQEVAAPLRVRLADVQARRERTATWLAGEVERTREALREMTQSQRRVAQIAPVYGGMRSEPRSRLCAVS